MLWGLADHFVDEVIELYRSREQAERALRAVLDDEPDWAGMMEVVPVHAQRASDGHWRPKGKPVPRPRCRRGF
jgi:hypothetical protein